MKLKISLIFTLMLILKKSNQLHFSRDFLGKKPLYYYMDNEKFILSSEEKGIFNLQKKNKSTIIAFLNIFFLKISFMKKHFLKILNLFPRGQNLI